ncbi:YxiG-like protein [Melissospora conviva]|uniref:YxiG-like protein n=1 Tax=Melissospora conviva TaxID=3388432 RepID=UPI003C198037
MDIDEIQAAFDDVFDQAMVFHGFADYMRDYDVFVYATADPRTGITPKYLRYRFRYCVRAVTTSAVPPEVWMRSLDERLVDHEQGVDLDGYVWGVKWQDLYPGMKLLRDSPDAERWSQLLYLPFHEAIIETNGHNISLVFSDLAVDTVDHGYAPFVVAGGGSDVKIPHP